MQKRRIYDYVTIRIMSVTRRIFTFSIFSVIIKPAQEQNKKGYGKMNGKRLFRTGVLLIDGFVLWTVLICTMDVQPVGVNGTSVGFAQLNGWFHQLTGVHMAVYHITDWLGLVPVCGCMVFAGIGLIQLALSLLGSFSLILPQIFEKFKFSALLFIVMMIFSSHTENWLLL